MKTIDELLTQVAGIVDSASVKRPDAEPAQRGETASDGASVEKRETALHSAAGYVPKERGYGNTELGMIPMLSLSFAKEIAYCIERGAEMLGVSAVIAVVNGGGGLMYLAAMDNSYPASVTAAKDKAYTAAALKMPTHVALKESRGGALDGFTNGNGILMLGGGYPINVGDVVVGGIGVSGGTKEQDMLLARIGVEYFIQRVKTKGAIK